MRLLAAVEVVAHLTDLTEAAVGFLSFVTCMCLSDREQKLDYW